MPEHSDYQAIDGIGVCQRCEVRGRLGSLCMHDEHSAAKLEINDIQKAIDRGHTSSDPKLFPIQAESKIVEKISQKRRKRHQI